MLGGVLTNIDCAYNGCKMIVLLSTLTNSIRTAVQLTKSVPISFSI